MLPRDAVVVVVVVIVLFVVVVVSCSSLELHGLAPHAKKIFQEEGTTVVGARKKLTAS
jgi:ABC-type Fe3+-citrate transport system substrate-binding protein